MAGDTVCRHLTFLFAFIAVLALIGVAAWLVRRFATNRLGANPNRGRMPRLAVIDAAAVDGRRRLVLVRRDNVEHLLMIGGPSDIVVEPNIVRATPGARSGRRGLRSPATQPPRLAPLPDAAWSDGDRRPRPTCSITPSRKCPSRRRARAPLLRRRSSPPGAAAARRSAAAIRSPALRRSRSAAAPEPPERREPARPSRCRHG